MTLSHHRGPDGPPIRHEALDDGTLVTTYADGTMTWEQGIHHHRADGPAMARGDGEELWAIRGHCATPEHAARYQQLSDEAQAAADEALIPCLHGWNCRAQEACLDGVLAAVETLVDD